MLIDTATHSQQTLGDLVLVQSQPDESYSMPRIACNVERNAQGKFDPVSGRGCSYHKYISMQQSACERVELMVTCQKIWHVPPLFLSSDTSFCIGIDFSQH